MDENVRPDDMERITTPALAESFIDQQLAELRQQIGDKKVLLALSGGVDSSVVAALLIKAIGKQLICVHVNHGLLRKGEPEQVIEVFQNQMDANLIYVDAVDRFLDKLAGISDPEQKRKIIGKEFIDVFAEEAQKLEGISFLAQGTIYPDILESDGIKSHHNVGGLPEDLQFELVEPVKLLYKDEVRVVGRPKQCSTNIKTLPYPGFPTDMQPQMAVTLALAEGTSMITESIFENRFKYVDELARMGGSIKVEGNVAVIDGVKGFTGARVESPDLRAGAALVLAGLSAQGYTVVDEIGYIQRGYEKFEEKLQSLGAAIEMVDSEKEAQKFRLKTG